jgi:hypothetical protein
LRTRIKAPTRSEKAPPNSGLKLPNLAPLGFCSLNLVSYAAATRAKRPPPNRPPLLRPVLRDTNWPRRALCDSAVALSSWVRYPELMAVNKLAELIDAARTLSPEERRRLIVELDALEVVEQVNGLPDSDPLAALRALSGTVHSGFVDISTDKYAHVAAAAGDPES